MQEPKQVSDSPQAQKEPKQGIKRGPEDFDKKRAAELLERYSSFRTEAEKQSVVLEFGESHFAGKTCRQISQALKELISDFGFKSVAPLVFEAGKTDGKYQNDLKHSVSWQFSYYTKEMGASQKYAFDSIVRSQVDLAISKGNNEMAQRLSEHISRHSETTEIKQENKAAKAALPVAFQPAQIQPEIAPELSKSTANLSLSVAMPALMFFRLAHPANDTMNDSSLIYSQKSQANASKSSQADAALPRGAGLPDYVSGKNIDNAPDLEKNNTTVEKLVHKTRGRTISRELFSDVFGPENPFYASPYAVFRNAKADSYSYYYYPNSKASNKSKRAKTRATVVKPAKAKSVRKAKFQETKTKNTKIRPKSSLQNTPAPDEKKAQKTKIPVATKKHYKKPHPKQHQKPYQKPVLKTANSKPAPKAMPAGNAKLSVQYKKTADASKIKLKAEIKIRKMIINKENLPKGKKLQKPKEASAVLMPKKTIKLKIYAPAVIQKAAKTAKITAKNDKKSPENTKIFRDTKRLKKLIAHARAIKFFLLYGKGKNKQSKTKAKKQPAKNKINKN